MKNLLNKLFLLCLCGALILALGYVLVEIAAVLTTNGALSIWAEANLEAPVCIMCSLTAIVAFIMNYVFKWTSAD